MEASHARIKNYVFAFLFFLYQMHQTFTLPPTQFRTQPLVFSFSLLLSIQPTQRHFSSSVPVTKTDNRSHFSSPLFSPQMNPLPTTVEYLITPFSDSVDQRQTLIHSLLLKCSLPLPPLLHLISTINSPYSSLVVPHILYCLLNKTKSKRIRN